MATIFLVFKLVDKIYNVDSRPINRHKESPKRSQEDIFAAVLGVLGKKEYPELS